MERANLLHEEGLEICADFGFLDLLGRYGEARLVGSVALNLVVKPDIDFHLFVEQNQVLDVTKSVLEKLIADKRISEVRISDYLEMDSLKVGVDRLSGRTTDWTIDIWITSDRNTLGFDELEEYKKLINEENRNTVIEIKRHYLEMEQLRQGLSSMIYRAVFLENITTIREFQRYHKEIMDSEEDKTTRAD